MKSLMPDKYELHARYKPAALLVVPPWVFCTVALSWAAGEDVFQWVSLGGGVGLTIFWFAAANALVDWMRRRAKKKEKQLFLESYGKCILPSVRFLRHKDLTINRFTKERYIKKIFPYLDEIKAWPTKEEEEENLAACDEVYENASHWLKEHSNEFIQTDIKTKELISYGFTRNLLGSKDVAIGLLVLSLVVSLVIVTSKTSIENDLNLLALFVHSVIALLWMVVVTEDLVIKQAETYAVKMLACADLLPDKTEPVVDNPSSPIITTSGS